MKRLFKIAAITLGVLLVPYLGCVHHTEPGHVGIMRNWASGETKLDTPGWNLSPPWVKVAKVDARPIRVCVTSSGRGFNCKLVQFVPEAFQEFVATEGFRYYWWANRVSFNFGYDEEYRGMKDLLRGYAYGVQKYRFVRVIQDY